MNADLPEDVAEMPFDGARAQEQAPADLSIGKTLFDEVRDLLLLSSELQRSSIEIPARSSPRGRRELAPCALGEGPDPHLVQRLVRDFKLLARIASSVSATQPLTIEKVRPRQCNS